MFLFVCLRRKAQENKFRKLTVAILSELSPIPNDGGAAKPKRRSSAFDLSDDLHRNSISTLSAAKAFVKDYRTISQEIATVAAAAAKERVPAERQRDQGRQQLQLLLEKQGRRLKDEIHAMLDGAEVSSTDRYDAPAEEELWTRYGAADPEEKGKLSPGATGEGWNQSVSSSKKALRRLVQCLPDEEDQEL